MTTQSWYNVDTIDYRPSKNHEPFSEPILLQIPNSYRLGNLPVFFFEIRCFREFKNFFHTFRSALTHCHESAPVQDISMFLHKTNHTESKFQHGTNLFNASERLMQQTVHCCGVSFICGVSSRLFMQIMQIMHPSDTKHKLKVPKAKWSKSDTKVTKGHENHIFKQLLKFWTNNKNKEIHMWYTETTQWPELRLTGSFNFTSIFFHLATTTTATMHLFSQPFVSIFCWKMTETHGTQMILIVEAFVRVEIPT